MIFAIILVLLVAPPLQSSNISFTTADRRELQGEMTGGERTKTNQLLIMTQGRSGSSFVGELVSKVPGALYLYEPCRSLVMTKDAAEKIHFGQVEEPVCQAMAARVLGCQITEKDAEKMFKDFVAINLCNIHAVVELSSKRVRRARLPSGRGAWPRAWPPRLAASSGLACELRGPLRWVPTSTALARRRSGA